MKRPSLFLILLLLPLLLGGCSGGQEIESCLFVIAMAVDPAQDGNLTVTVKALSGSQDAATGGAQSEEDAGGGEKTSTSGQSEDAEQTEPGYVVLSATAPSCLRALNLLSATTPRTINLSQLQEIVLSETLARTEATLSILREIHAMYRANGEAIVVVTPDDAGDFIRRQHALLGVRLSKYLKVLFENFSRIDTIPPGAQLSAVIAAMESGVCDAAAVYAAGNDFSATLVLPGAEETDRLPGHLPRTSPAQNEYLGSALFSGPRMTGTLTGSETSLLCLLMGRAHSRTIVVGGAQYRVNVNASARRTIAQDGTLCARVRISLSLLAGGEAQTQGELAADIEQRAVNLMQKLQTLACDALGFGCIAVRGSLSIPAWERRNWPAEYAGAAVRASVFLRIV